jgi:hypothetical protein
MREPQHKVLGAHEATHALHHYHVAEVYVACIATITLRNTI